MSTRYEAVCDECGWTGRRFAERDAAERQSAKHVARCVALVNENAVVALLQLVLNARTAIQHGRPWLGHLLDAQIALDDLVVDAKPRRAAA